MVLLSLQYECLVDDLRSVKKCPMIKDVCEYCLNNREYLLRVYPLSSGQGKYIKDPVHGMMFFETDELILIDSCYMQRLRKISQLSFIHYLFPSARHSRFEHSLGMTYLVKKIFDIIREKGIPEEGQESLELKKKMLIYSALLHDIGHGPFSHASEEFAYLLNELMSKRRKETKIHERRSSQIISDRFIRRKEGVKYVKFTNCLYRTLRSLLSLKFDLDYSETRLAIISIADCIMSYHEKPFGGLDYALRRLINGPLDADKLDYLLRDSYHAGFKISQAFDVDRIILGYGIHKDRKGRYILTLEEKAALEVLSLLNARLMEKSAVWGHPLTVVTAGMMRKALYMNMPKPQSLRALQSYKGQLLGLDDKGFFDLLGDLRKKGKIIKVDRMLENRYLFKKLLVWKTDQALPKIGDGRMIFLSKIEEEIANKAFLEEEDVIACVQEPYEALPDIDDLKELSIYSRFGNEIMNFLKFSKNTLGLDERFWRGGKSNLSYIIICVPPDKIKTSLLTISEQVLMNKGLRGELMDRSKLL